jgi:hypothetical protein
MKKVPVTQAIVGKVGRADAKKPWHPEKHGHMARKKHHLMHTKTETRLIFNNESIAMQIP